MEDKILALYAKGVTTRDIEHLMQDLYGVEISHTVISQITDGVLDEVRAWQNRPLDVIYPIVWLDGIVVKVHHGKQVVNKSAHVVLGVNLNLTGCSRPNAGILIVSPSLDTSVFFTPPHDRHFHANATY